MTAFSTKRFLSASLSLTAVAGALSFANPAFAQNAPAAEEADAGGAIVVTARKREEDLLDVPLTVTAITAEALAVRGVATMQDVANSTPGININDSSSGHADRGFQQIVLRGFTPVTTLATTTSLFIDGVVVSSPSAFTSISSPERIEILKGPQSAFFGRNTFAGAINVVNKVPGNDWHGAASGTVGTHDNYRAHGEIEGPLIRDILSFRASVDYFKKSGSWTNAADGRTLGDQSSLSGTALLVFKPTDRITIKGFALLSRDRDGAPANARLVAQDVKDSAGNIILKNQANCTFQGDSSGVAGIAGTPVTNSYICGTLPGLINPISANATDDAITRAFLYFAPNRRLIAPEDGVQGYGLLRQYRHYHVTADIELTDELTASFLAGWGREYWNTMIDLDGFDGSKLTVGMPGVAATSPRGFYDFPFLVERRTRDSSLEARLSYDAGRIHAVAGFSYLDAIVQSGQRGSTTPLVEGNAFPATATSPGGVSQNKTYGGFFGLTYDATDALSISVEGRYQSDKILAYAPPIGIVIPSSALIPAGTYAPNSVLAEATYKNFTPRVIVNYDISPDMMIYASWSKGVNPSQFNSSILTSSDVIQTQAAQAGVKVAVEPEKLTNYEIGIKGKALNGALRYSLSAYYAQWRNQINAVSFTVPTTPVPTLASGVQNSGSLDLKGIEVEAAWRVNDVLAIDFAGAINDTSFKSFKNRALSQLTGIYDFTGKEMPYSSKYSFNLGAQVGTEIGGWDDGRWFARADWSYKSGTWSGQANTTKTSARNVVNVRAGISKGPFSLEAFVTNLFNDTNYTSLIDQTLFDPGVPGGAKANAALFVNLPDKRTAGVQLKFKF
jgi:iron complex outermembrane receptor protein